MPIQRIICPECGAGLKSAAGFNVGQKLRCPKCETPFAVEEPEEEPVPVSPARKPVRAAVEDDDDDDEVRQSQPKKKKKKRPRDDDDEGGFSYKKSWIRYVVLGVLFIVLGVLGYLLYEKNRKKADDAPNNELTEEDYRKPLPLKPNADRGNPPKKGKSAGAVYGVPIGVKSRDNLAQLGRAMHSFASETSDAGHLPTAAICNAQGKPLLSWRVAMLPFIEQAALYQKFKLDEPWDSANNKPLLDLMPKTFQSSLAGAAPGMTYYKVFTNGNADFGSAPFGVKKPVANLNRFPDGTANTIMIIEAGPAVEWTKPEDIVFEPEKPLPDLELPGGVRRINIALCDGSVGTIDLSTIKPETLKAAITWNGGEILGADWKNAR